MTDKDSKANQNPDLQIEDAEKDVFTDATNDQHTFDHLQDDFNSLISEASTPYEEPADAFNDLADAFSMETSPSSDPEAGFTSHLDESLNDFAAPAMSEDTINSTTPFASESAPEFPQSLANNSVVGDDDDDGLESLSHLNTPFSDEPPLDHSLPKSQLPIFDSDEFEPIADQFEAHDNSPEKASNSLFENETPVFADLSESNNDVERPKNYIIAFAAIILMATAGGIYWYMMGTADQPTEQFTEQPTEKSVQMVEGEQLELPTPQLTDKPASLSTVEAIKLLEFQKTTPKPITTASNIIAPVATTHNDAWNIIAPVTSKTIAQQLVKKFKSKYMDSDILHAKHNGQNVYFIRIKGFISKQSALKRSNRLAKSSHLNNLKVVKDSTELTSQVLFSAPAVSIKKASTKKAVKKTVKKAPKPIVKKPTQWAIVAPVNSNKIARQYVARLHVKHINGEAIQFNHNGKTQYFVRIKGFNSKHSAEKRLTRLAKTWGLANAKIQQL